MTPNHFRVHVQADLSKTFLVAVLYAVLQKASVFIPNIHLHFLYIFDMGVCPLSGKA